MSDSTNIFIPCVVKECGPDADGPAEYVVAQSVKRLSDQDLPELGLSRQCSQETGRTQEAIQAEPHVPETTSRMIDATINVIAEQINNLDIEAEMLVLRKRALKRRLRILERLAKSLSTSEYNRKAS